MSEFQKYRKKQVSELRSWEPGESLEGVSISDADRKAGSPKEGDRIARNPKDPSDRWLVSEAFFLDNFELVS